MDDYSNNLLEMGENGDDVNPIVVQEGNYPQQQEQENSLHIQMQHKIRQQMLLMHLEKLRNYDEKRKLQQSAIADVEFNTNNNLFKWLNPLLMSLEQAHRYVKNNVRKTEQLSECFPSASHSFESRCSDLRQNLLRLELSIERFKNIFTKQLDVAEQNFKSFISDFHLESFVQETEEEEDFKECRGQSSSHHDTHSDDETAVVDCRDMEPVPEIRDINSDSPIPVDEITGDISYLNSEEDDESNYIFVRNTSSHLSPSQLISVTKPTITIKPVKFSSTPGSSKTNFDSSGVVETNTVKGTQNKRNSLRYSTKRASKASPDHPPQAKLKTSHHQKRKG